MPSSRPKRTPMMRQWHDIKAKYPDAIIFFRLGDFYETFYKDAEIASRELNITLTSRSTSKTESAPLAGVPYHALDSYLPKLVRKGYKVAICEQMEEAKPGKLVDREVIRVVSAGTIHESTYLDDKSNNYLMALCQKNDYGLAFVDISTGEFNCTQISESEGIDGILTQIFRFRPAECLIQTQLYKDEKFIGELKGQTEMLFTPYPDINFDPDIGKRELTQHFGVLSLHGYDIQNFPAIIGASGATLKYLQETQLTPLSNIKTLRPYTTADYMIIDAATQRNLELIHNIREGTSRGTLLEIFDHTETAMGGRLLRRWLLQPLIKIKQIEARFNAVSELVSGTFIREEIKNLLRKISDLERLVSRISYGTANARDLIALRNSLEIIPLIKEQLQKSEARLLAVKVQKGLHPLSDIKDLLFKAIVDEPPVSVREGRIIRNGYNQELDEIRTIRSEGTKWIKNLESQERSKTGVQNLKIGYNKIFGYFIEITKSNLRKLKGAAKEYVDTQYIRKQTLVNAERFVTPEMKEREEKILTAQEKINDLEYQLFTDIRNQVAENIESIQATAQVVAKLDVLVTFAKIAIENNYNRPKINNQTIIRIKDGRHPVVEKLVYQEPFIPNDALLDCNENQLLVVTGPNMAGKSTYLRQVALIVLLAQMGSFVPATDADIGLVDRIFSRVGAFDDLTMQRSTFMVEMNEMASILHNATKKSLIIIDEIGRGTSTFDGLSIAWAVGEFILNSQQIGARTLFATHFHQLIELEDHFKGVKNYNIAVKEEGDTMIFLRKIMPGGTSKSYGIQVAQLAGMPKEVIVTAKRVLLRLEKLAEGADISQEPSSAPPAPSKVWKEPTPHPKDQTSLFSYFESPIQKKLKQLDIDSLTPLQALALLAELKEEAKKRN
ncbi:MAG: DNA mismatch repair protein MutS [Promethearchaeota archaeon]